MTETKIELVYMGLQTVLDLRRVVAMTRPKDGKFLIYFENAVWTLYCVGDFDRVYNAWMAL